MGAFWVQKASFCGDLLKKMLKGINEGIDHNFMR